MGVAGARGTSHADGLGMAGVAGQLSASRAAASAGKSGAVGGGAAAARNDAPPATARRHSAETVRSIAESRSESLASPLPHAVQLGAIFPRIARRCFDGR